MAKTRASTKKTPAKREISNTQINRSNTQLSNRYSNKLIIALILLAVLGLIFISKKFLIAASVNGKPISRMAVISELEKKGGKQTLDSLISETLILEEAKKRGIEVSQADIDAEIKRIEESVKTQGQDLDQLLTAQGINRESLKKNVKIQKILEKMVGPDIKVTQKEIDDFVEANKASIPEGTDPNVLKSEAEKQLKSQKINQKTQTLLQELKSKAKINYYVKY